jgi:uncharacterized protein (DUF1697 family)
MPRVVAFLRAINVPGHMVKMDVLREVFQGLGFTNVETFIASGNVIFETRAKNFRALENRIESALLQSLGYEVATFIRTIKDVDAIAQYQPFEPQVMNAAVALNVGLLKEALSDEVRASLARLKTECDDFHANGAQLYWICSKRQSESRISNTVFERALKAKSTFRGLRTLERLHAKFSV